MIHLLVNPFLQEYNAELTLKTVTEALKSDEIVDHDLTKIESLSSFFDSFPESDRFVLVGGDGTLNHFVNSIYGYKVKQKLYIYTGGSGNDFVIDIQETAPNEGGLPIINEYIERLPTVTVNGKTYRFLNGIGFGIDGYCCEEGDNQRAKSKKAINYAAIAIKGLIYAFKPRNAEVTVDGITKSYKRVWLSPAMFGRFYGGGLKIAPRQDRKNAGYTVSSVTIYGCGRLRALMSVSQIFAGEDTKNRDITDVRVGHNVTVTFDRPTPLQIDGETIRNVTSYTVHCE